MARKTSRWDAADTLETKEDIAAYLDAVLEDGDPDLLKAALGDIARAKGMTEIAHAAGLGRTNHQSLQGAIPGGQSGVRHRRQDPEGSGASALRRWLAPRLIAFRNLLRAKHDLGDLTLTSRRRRSPILSTGKDTASGRTVRARAPVRKIKMRRTTDSKIFSQPSSRPKL